MEPTDLRVRRTKQLIKTAFFELLEESGFEAVTVKQLTERAGINRGTFYSHYVDKFDLMAACIESIFEEAETKLIRHIPQVFRQQSDTKPYALLVPFIRFIEENRVLMKPLLGLNGDPAFQARLRAYMHRALFHRSPSVLFHEETALVPADYLIAYISSAHMGVIVDWLNRTESTETAEEIARIIYTITFEGPLVAGGLRRQ